MQGNTKQDSKLGHYQQALNIIKKTSDNYKKIASLINMAKIHAKSQQPVDKEIIKYLQDLSSKYDLFNYFFLVVSFVFLRKI